MTFVLSQSTNRDFKVFSTSVVVGPQPLVVVALRVTRLLPEFKTKQRVKLTHLCKLAFVLQIMCATLVQRAAIFISCEGHRTASLLPPFCALRTGERVKAVSHELGLVKFAYY